MSAPQLGYSNCISCSTSLPLRQTVRQCRCCCPSPFPAPPHPPHLTPRGPEALCSPLIAPFAALEEGLPPWSALACPSHTLQRAARLFCSAFPGLRTPPHHSLLFAHPTTTPRSSLAPPADRGDATPRATSAATNMQCAAAARRSLCVQ